MVVFELIKYLGINGGGFFGLNLLYLFENLIIILNIVEILFMMILLGVCVVVFGYMIKNKK